MKFLVQVLENLLLRRRNSDFVLVAAGGFGLCLAVGGYWNLWIPGMIVGLVFAVIVRFSLRWKQKILREPLRLSEPAVVQRVDGRDLVMVRAVLGRGRCIRPESVEAWIQPKEGEQRPLVVAWVPEVVVGPWTIAVERPEEDGELCLRVVGREKGRQHETESRWNLEGVQQGTFAPMCGWKGGRLCGNTSQWDTVMSCGSSSQPLP